MAAAATRVFLKYPILDGDLVLDVTEVATTIATDTGGAAITTIGARLQLLTLARDSVTVYVAADNIAGMHVLPLVQ